ncbi:MAG: hypothetical protein KGL39_24240 [Patescibacteria group bacterium]|nr:hypothetical protein [Patescibacteria group bacterium]
MIAPEFVYDPAWSTRVRNRLSSAKVRQGMHRAALQVAAYGTLALRDYAPKRTGQFAASIHANVLLANNDVRVSFVAEQPLATWIIKGTRPHIIQPRTKKVLRFVASSGEVVFAPIVHHPGTRPNDFRRPAFNELRELTHQAFLGAVRASMGI